MADTSNHDSDAEPEALNIFTEPADYYPPSPTPTTVTHTLLSGQSLSLRLVGFNVRGNPFHPLFLETLFTWPLSSRRTQQLMSLHE
jgi:hypothetical protein